jgi:hypothetical protein
MMICNIRKAKYNKRLIKAKYKRRPNEIKPK